MRGAYVTCAAAQLAGRSPEKKTREQPLPSAVVSRARQPGDMRTTYLGVRGELDHWNDPTGLGTDPKAGVLTLWQK